MGDFWNHMTDIKNIFHTVNKHIEQNEPFVNVLPVNLCQQLFFCRTWGEHVVFKNCSECQKQFLYTTCSPHVLQKEELLTKIYLYVFWLRFVKEITCTMYKNQALLAWFRIRPENVNSCDIKLAWTPLHNIVQRLY